MLSYLDIENTLKDIEEVLELFQTHTAIEQRIKDGIKQQQHHQQQQQLPQPQQPQQQPAIVVPTVTGEFDLFLEAMDKLNEAINFLSRNRNFKSAPKALDNLVCCSLFCF